MSLVGSRFLPDVCQGWSDVALPTCNLRPCGKALGTRHRHLRWHANQRVRCVCVTIECVRCVRVCVCVSVTMEIGMEAREHAALSLASRRQRETVTAPCAHIMRARRPEGRRVGGPAAACDGPVGPAAACGRGPTPHGPGAKGGLPTARNTARRFGSEKTWFRPASRRCAPAA